jgi:hypothetical protein
MVETTIKMILTGKVRQSPKPTVRTAITPAIIVHTKKQISHIAPADVFPAYIQPKPKKPNNPGRISKTMAILRSFGGRGA